MLVETGDVSTDVLIAEGVVVVSVADEDGASMGSAKVSCCCKGS